MRPELLERNEETLKHNKVFMEKQNPSGSCLQLCSAATIKETLCFVSCFEQEANPTAENCQGSTLEVPSDPNPLSNSLHHCSCLVATIRITTAEWAEEQWVESTLGLHLGFMTLYLGNLGQVTPISLVEAGY